MTPAERRLRAHRVEVLVELVDLAERIARKLEPGDDTPLQRRAAFDRHAAARRGQIDDLEAILARPWEEAQRGA